MLKNSDVKKIIGIMGAGGLAREVLELARLIDKKEQKWEEFILIDIEDTNEISNGAHIYSYETAKEKYGASLEIAMGIGEPVLREKLFKEVVDDGFVTPTLIHPDVYIPETTTVGQGVVIQYGCFISCNVTIKDYVFIQPHCNIGHDDVLEEGCMLSGFSNLGGSVHIGKYAYVGLSSAIKQTINIGNYAIIGFGSMVHKDVQDEMIVMGNPARTIAKNENKRVFGH